MPKDILQASMSSLDLSDGDRFEAIRAATEFLGVYEPGKKYRHYISTDHLVLGKRLF